MLGSHEPRCAACGGPRNPRKREACSDRCRAALSRRRRAQRVEQTTRTAGTANARAQERMTFRASRLIVEQLSPVRAEIRGRMLPSVVNAKLVEFAELLAEEKR